MRGIDDNTRNYLEKMLGNAADNAKKDGVIVQPEIFSEMLDSLKDHKRVDYEKTLEDVAAKAKAEGLMVRSKVLYGGKPGESIIKFAEREKVDLIAIGSHNRGTLERFFLGSVSFYVIQHAHCAVLVVK